MIRYPEIELSDEVLARLRAPIQRQKGTPIYVEIYRRLQQMIVEGFFKKGNRLPSETELAALTNIGRTSLRSAFILLYEDGYVETYHGKGTYVIYDPDVEASEFLGGTFGGGYILPLRKLRSFSNSVEIVYADHRRNSYDAFLDRALQLNGKPINSLTQLVTRDGAHAVLAYCYYPAEVFCGQNIDDSEEAARVLEDYFDRAVSSATTTFTAVPASGLKNADTGTKISGSNFLLVSSTWRDASGRPLAYCKDYYCTDVVRYCVELPAIKEKKEQI